jgi:15-cis-phytoene synthase
VSNEAGIAAPEADGEAVAAAARAGEPDRYLAALLAPPPRREALLALAAFAAEVARIPRLVVREPLMGEMRLQWWRDALALAEGQRTGHGVADAVRRAGRSYGLPAALLEGLIEARLFELGGGPFADERKLHEFLWSTEGALFALAARVLGLPPGADVDAVCGAAGQAYGMARLLFALPQSLAQGRIPFSQTAIAKAGVDARELLAGTARTGVDALLGDCRAQIRHSLGSARRLVARLPRGSRIAFLPLALVRSYVRAQARADRLSLREEARIAPLTRVSRIAAAHVFGRL